MDQWNNQYNGGAFPSQDKKSKYLAQYQQYEMYTLYSAICQMDSPSDFGYVILTQQPNLACKIDLHLKNLPPGEHAFHIHEFADKRQGCASLGEHYNPTNGVHKGLNEPGNHIGDFGNIKVSADGTCNTSFVVNYLPLVGKDGVIGRSMVIHGGVDDLGRGNNPESKKSGNSGHRIACGIIGFLRGTEKIE
jgi:Cu-Zn family superoxide dismutase